MELPQDGIPDGITSSSEAIGGEDLMRRMMFERFNQGMSGLFEDWAGRASDPVSRMASHRENTGTEDDAPPTYDSLNMTQQHSNKVIEAATIRSQDEKAMQSMLRKVQLKRRVYNSDIEPEHDSLVDCDCIIHQYMVRKFDRLGVQEMWSKAVAYPGEKVYHNCYQSPLLSNNPYGHVVSPYDSSGYGEPALRSNDYTLSLQQTVQLNLSLNEQAQAAVDAKEPLSSIWEIGNSNSLARGSSSSSGQPDDGNQSTSAARDSEGHRRFQLRGLKKTFSIKSLDERTSARARGLRDAIMAEEYGRWPDAGSQQAVRAYQESIGMTQEVAKLRSKCPTQYLHLLRAGYFEPIPAEWANLDSHPLMFRIDAPGGWRGITPAWRGFKNTAEERLYWVLNHRDGKNKIGVKPDSISAMKMARSRIASAVEPPTAYYSDDDTCKLHHIFTYSKQPIPTIKILNVQGHRTGSTVILLDVSKSMDTPPIRPSYDQYLITSHFRYAQPKTKDTSRAIVRRFIDAMTNHDNNPDGYPLFTFSTEADFVGLINRRNFQSTWSRIRFGGGTRVMAALQKAKDLHFQQYPESATYHPIYGWQAGPRTPMLRLLLVLDGEASDMHEFELELLSLPWIQVTIFLVGVDGSLHHHCHANELQRISETHSNISFVDAQGNIPERFVTHELLKRHLGCNFSMRDFEELEQLPPSYVE
ncbi:hypothetical protein PMAA_090430 [Paecilomyces variotii No. 5]|uniref:VWFA domain-containing protein n=1 Tax=Byssochlamys spectabilis (strain No. 5 / NBRC 109023) TaxID=1356009 RepID=V5FDL0_BYSSN|nr:hypothetical protein PMAA_090430 [Paecilomyces variotii No. 5]